MTKQMTIVEVGSLRVKSYCDDGRVWMKGSEAPSQELSSASSGIQTQVLVIQNWQR